MEVELKTVKISKSKILQMDYVRIPTNPNLEVLGWVNMDKKRWVIVKINSCFYRAEFIITIEKEIKGVQFSLVGGGYEFPYLTNIICYTHNNSKMNFSVYRDDERNIKLYDNLISFKRKTEIAGQIYY